MREVHLHKFSFNYLSSIQSLVLGGSPHGICRYMIPYESEPWHAASIPAEIVSFSWVLYSCFIFVHLWGKRCSSCAGGVVPAAPLGLVSAPSTSWRLVPAVHQGRPAWRAPFPPHSCSVPTEHTSVREPLCRERPCLGFQTCTASP